MENIPPIASLIKTNEGIDKLFFLATNEHVRVRKTQSIQKDIDWLASPSYLAMNKRELIESVTVDLLPRRPPSKPHSPAGHSFCSNNIDIECLETFHKYFTRNCRRSCHSSGYYIDEEKKLSTWTECKAELLKLYPSICADGKVKRMIDGIDKYEKLTNGLKFLIGRDDPDPYKEHKGHCYESVSIIMHIDELREKEILKSGKAPKEWLDYLNYMHGSRESFAKTAEENAAVERQKRIDNFETERLNKIRKLTDELALLEHKQIEVVELRQFLSADESLAAMFNHYICNLPMFVLRRLIELHGFDTICDTFKIEKYFLKKLINHAGFTGDGPTCHNWDAKMATTEIAKYHANHKKIEEQKCYCSAYKLMQTFSPQYRNFVMITWIANLGQGYCKYDKTCGIALEIARQIIKYPFETLYKYGQAYPDLDFSEAAKLEKISSDLRQYAIYGVDFVPANTSNEQCVVAEIDDVEIEGAPSKK